MQGNLVAIKTYETGKLDLYDIVKDISERKDLSVQMSQKATELENKMNAYLKEINAQMPIPNPNFDPSKPASSTRGGGRGEGGGGRRGNQDRRRPPKEQE